MSSKKPIKKQRKRINVTFDLETYDQIHLLADLRNTHMSEVIRLWSLEALNGQVAANNIDLITKIMSSELKNIIQPQIERLASLNAKTCIQASTSAYLNAEALANLVPLELQQDLEYVYEVARKKGVAYTKNKISNILDDVSQ